MCSDAVRNQLVKENDKQDTNKDANESIDVADNLDNGASFVFAYPDDSSTQEEPASNERIFQANEDSSLIAQYNKYCSNGKNKMSMQPNKYKSAIDLLDILHRAGSPLYLFDKIMKWAKKSTFAHHFDFNDIPIRDKFIAILMKQLIII
jgi:hypothetical protein